MLTEKGILAHYLHRQSSEHNNFLLKKFPIFLGCFNSIKNKSYYISTKFPRTKIELTEIDLFLLIFIFLITEVSN